jgi:AraC-like DNA-binding protein
LKTYLTVSIIGGLQGILLALFFFIKGRKKLAILMLSLYLFVFSAGLFENWIEENSHNIFFKVLLSFVGNSSYLYGPFLYLFVHYLVYEINIFRRKDICHFLPFTVFFIAELCIIIFKGDISKNSSDILELVQFELLIIQTIIYNLLAIRELKGHYNFILQTYSSIEKRDLNWLKFFLVIITCIYCFSFLLSHLLLFGISKAGNFFFLIQIAITSCIYLMSYVVLSSPHLFVIEEKEELTPELEKVMEDEPAIKELNDTAMPIEEKYKKSGLKLELAVQHLGLLERLMKEQKLYKNTDLNIQALSLQLGISKNHLTQIINEQLKMNFFEFINSHRIEEAKRLLLNPEYSHLSLTGIAGESGYKSKATFFANFKKVTGLTPLEWQKQNNKATNL